MRRIAFGVAIMATLTTSTWAQNDPPLNVPEWQSAVDIIQGAKADIVQNGWMQHPEAGSSVQCLSTALEKSWQSQKKTMVDFAYARMAVDDAIGAPPITALSTKDDPLSVPYWGRYYMYWNDAAGRKKEDVIAVLDKAADFAQMKKTDAVKINRTGADLDKYDTQMMVQFKLQ